MEKTYGDDYNKVFDKFGKANVAFTAVGTVVGTLGKIKAGETLKKAEEIYNSARDRYMSSFHIFEDSTQMAKETITNVVCLKKQIMGNYMKKFLKAYKRLAPQIRLQDSQGLGELRRFMFEKEDVKDIEKLTNAYALYNKKQLGDKAFNVALLMVQDGTVSNLATNIREVINAGKNDDIELKNEKMDEFKIQSIGVISQFSTIAIEFGLEGLNDIIVSENQLDRAKAAEADFELKKGLIDEKITIINAIIQYANVHLDLLNRFVPLMDEYVDHSVRIISSKDNIICLGRIQEDKFTQDELAILAFTFSLVEAVKAVIDSPIISQDGKVFDGDKSDFNRVQSCMETFKIRSRELKSLEMKE